MKKKKDNEKNTKKIMKSQQQEDDDDDGLNISLAAMEELKPKVLNDFNDITKLFKKLQKHVKN